jgi:regulator of sirC expression with transglutaminase-like and TPR domain
MDLVERWRLLLTRPDAELPLDEAALVIAAHGSPGLDIATQLGRLDDLAREVPRGEVDAVCTLLFSTLGLAGDSATYDDPRNSYLDQVLDRRRGIPISLSVLLIEVARRCGVPLQGVGMPGHFLVRDPAVPDRFIDAFARGRRLGHHECAHLLRTSTGSSMDLDPAMLAPIGPKVILARMLANLDQSYQHRSDRRSLVWVRRLRVLIPDLPLSLRVELAGGLADLGAFDTADALLSELAESAERPGGDPELAESIRTRALQVRARLN